MADKTVVFLIRMTPEMHDDLRQLAKAEDRSMAGQARLLISQGLERKKVHG